MCVCVKVKWIETTDPSPDNHMDHNPHLAMFSRIALAMWHRDILLLPRGKGHSQVARRVASLRHPYKGIEGVKTAATKGILWLPMQSVVYCNVWATLQPDVVNNNNSNLSWRGVRLAQETQEWIQRERDIGWQVCLGKCPERKLYSIFLTVEHGLQEEFSPKKSF